MSIKYVEGDLFASVLADIDRDPVVIAHVCNDKGGWGSGFVVPLGRTFPESKKAYRDWHEKNVPVDYMPFEMGQTQLLAVDRTPITFIANMVAQTLGGTRPLHYNHLARCMDTVAKFVKEQRPARDFSIVAPMFGSGLAGGNWGFVEELINDCWIRSGIDVTVHWMPGMTPQGWTPPLDTSP